MKFVHVKENGEKIFCEALTKTDIDYCKNSPRWEEASDFEEESIPEAVIDETPERLKLETLLLSGQVVDLEQGRTMTLNM